MSQIWWDFSDKLQPLKCEYRCELQYGIHVIAEGEKCWTVFLSKFLSFQKEVEVFWLYSVVVGKKEKIFFSLQFYFHPDFL